MNLLPEMVLLQITTYLNDQDKNNLIRTNRDLYFRYRYLVDYNNEYDYYWTGRKHKLIRFKNMRQNLVPNSDIHPNTKVITVNNFYNPDLIPPTVLTLILTKPIPFPIPNHIKTLIIQNHDYVYNFPLPLGLTKLISYVEINIEHLNLSNLKHIEYNGDWDYPIHDGLETLSIRSLDSFETSMLNNELVLPKSLRRLYITFWFLNYNLPDTVEELLVFDVNVISVQKIHQKVKLLYITNIHSNTEYRRIFPNAVIKFTQLRSGIFEEF